jgi:hypothetical protein
VKRTLRDRFAEELRGTFGNQAEPMFSTYVRIVNTPIVRCAKLSQMAAWRKLVASFGRYGGPTYGKRGPVRHPRLSRFPEDMPTGPRSADPLTWSNLDCLAPIGRGNSRPDRAHAHGVAVAGTSDCSRPSLTNRFRDPSVTYALPWASSTTSHGDWNANVGDSRKKQQNVAKMIVYEIDSRTGVAIDVPVPRVEPRDSIHEVPFRDWVRTPVTTTECRRTPFLSTTKEDRVPTLKMGRLLSQYISDVNMGSARHARILVEPAHDVLRFA